MKKRYAIYVPLASAMTVLDLVFWRVEFGVACLAAALVGVILLVTDRS